MKMPLCIAMILLVAGVPVGLAQNSGPDHSDAIDAIEEESVPTAQPANQQLQMAVRTPAQEPPEWHFEIGGSFANVANGYGRWYSGDAKISYSGFTHFTPMLSVGSQTRPEGTQQAYGVGSYVNFGKFGYAIVGVGVAPNRGVILYPNFRFDVMGVVPVPPVKGLLVTAGYTGYRMGGGHSKDVSVGGIYYTRVILEGGMSFSFSYPGGLPSKSGHFTIMTGRQGDYWLAAGASGGNIHYRLLGIIPYDVRMNAYGFSASFQKWLGSNWGLTTRYYFTNVINAYTGNSVSLNLFVDF